MVAVGDQCGAVESLAGSQADLGGDLVADEADSPGGGQDAEVIEGLRVDQAIDRRRRRDAGADEDRGDDEVAGALLSHERAHDERDPHRDRGECVADVVDQVGQQRHAARGDEDDALQDRGDEQHPRLVPTASRPSRERMIERSISPWLWPRPSWPWPSSRMCLFISGRLFSRRLSLRARRSPRSRPWPRRPRRGLASWLAPAARHRDELRCRPAGRAQPG